MKIAIRITQYIVALLFIFSGLIKANDPLGLAYKMEEFFDLWIDGLNASHFFARTALADLLHFFNQHTLFLSVGMITLEIVTGVALLLGWMKRPVLYLLLALILFFAFLTGYAYLSGRFTNCGCFGDCLPITPKTSYAKDLLLLVMIVFLITGQRHIRSIARGRLGSGLVAASLVLSLLLQWYVLVYLPLLDCLPMKKGNNIAEQIHPPKNAIPTVYESRLVYRNAVTGKEKDMSQAEFNQSRIWEDSSWKWKETRTQLIRKGTDIPALQNFSLKSLDGADLTDSVLNEKGYAILYFVNPGNSKGLFDKGYWNGAARKLPVFVVTSSPADFASDTSGHGYLVLTTDGTVFRIAARVNPTIYLIRQGTIIHKWPLAEAGRAKQFINDLKP